MLDDFELVSLNVNWLVVSGILFDEKSLVVGVSV